MKGRASIFALLSTFAGVTFISAAMLAQNLQDCRMFGGIALSALILSGFFILKMQKKIAIQRRRVSALKSKVSRLSIEAHAFMVDKIVELRRPLQGLIGIQDLYSQNTSITETKEYFEIADFCAQFLIRQLDRVQFFSELAQKNCKFISSRVRLRDLVKQSISMALEQANNRGVAVFEEWAEDVPQEAEVCAEPLKNILAEVIDNSARYGGGRRVNLQIATMNSRLVVTVCDQGPGLNELQISLLKSSQESDKNKISWAQARGGLGLYLIRKLAHSIGAEINIESQKGGGTSMSISVPLGQVAQSATPTRMKRSVEVSRQPLRVLVVDDDIIASRVIAAGLRNLGAQTDVASNGREAVSAAERGRFDVIFMDIEMPVMDGWQASEMILNDLSLHHLPYVIALTSYCRQEDYAKARELKLFELIAKPANLSTLKEVLERIYDAREAVVEDASESNAKEPGYLIDFNELYRLLGENMSMCREVLSSAGDVIATEMDVLASALAKSDAKQILDSTHRLQGEFAVIFCPDGVAICQKIGLAIKSNDQNQIQGDFDALAEIVERLLTEVDLLVPADAVAA